MHRLVRHSGQDVDRFSISCRWQHMKPWNLQRWSISSEVGAPAVSVPGWQRQHPRRPHHHEANDRAEGPDCCLQTRYRSSPRGAMAQPWVFPCPIPCPSHLCWNTPGACGCFDCFATRGACFNAGWHHEGERGGKVERHRAEGTLAHAGTGKVHMLPGDLVDNHLLLFVCYPILYFMSRFRRGNPCQHWGSLLHLICSLFSLLRSWPS